MFVHQNDCTSIFLHHGVLQKEGVERWKVVDMLESVAVDALNLAVPLRLAKAIPLIGSK